MISMRYGKAKKVYLLPPLVLHWQHLFPPESSKVKGIIKQRLFWGMEESWRFTANMLFLEGYLDLEYSCRASCDNLIHLRWLLFSLSN